MRKYPFRGLPINSKEFVYGWYGEMKGKPFIIDKGAKTWRGSFTEVIPESVGQFVKVINGKDIWEGDLLTGHRLPKRDPFTVEWDDDIAGFRLPYSYSEKELEIIGDIHTKPELLEKQ